MSSEIVLTNYCLGGSQIGIELTADERGLTACRLVTSQSFCMPATLNPYLTEAMGELANYFGGKSRRLSAHATPDGTEFQREVWLATASIPYGEVRSYAWLAEEIGRPKAVRAVAQALGANPLLLFVPCHRVLRSNGDLGGFSCGVEWKSKLLALEGVNSPDLDILHNIPLASASQPQLNL